MEQLEGDRLENEIVEEMQNLVEKFKVKEASELGLREQLAEMEKLLQVGRRRGGREGGGKEGGEEGGREGGRERRTDGKNGKKSKEHVLSAC